MPIISFTTYRYIPDIVGKIQPAILQSRDYEKLNEAVISSPEISKLEMLDKLI